ncbi:DUF1430 domain-containing protein [Thermoanaerobacterium thermosaccharolyticum]|uniref:DUF1430 domain-containing protein n=1 Tax=Thermoanaerobacterium thermosaccharolyticum TaxID=1517 RepID=UPI00177C42C4|nr:DUF1430 domain-containing protein [Thermoanaerobacterium thermosaccharolyticum]MBE0069982.1 DUF1430 domain-containing protein [Thermoanaerobacterium thermosaccharolyticum]
MRRVLVIFFILISAVSFLIAYNQTDKEEFKKMENAEKNMAKSFVIPDDLLLADPDGVYPLLNEAANEARVNIFRTNVHYKSDDHVEIIKYVLLTSDTNFFDVFRLRKGRFFTIKDTRNENIFISTIDTGDCNQIGIIRDFGGNNIVTIKPLKACYEQLPVYGQYYVEASDSKAFDVFLKSFVSKINEKYKKYLKEPYTTEYFLKAKDVAEIEVGSWEGILVYSRYIILAVILILLIYYIFYESKRISIMKMHGLPSIKIWFILIGRLIIFVFALSMTISLIGAMFIKDMILKFISSVIISLIEIYAIATVSSLISYVYISKIKISEAIKNRKDTDGIFVLNTLLKAVCSIMVIFIILSVWGQYAKIGVKRENLRNWEHSKDYGVFYPLYIGYDIEDIKHGSPKLNTLLTNDLYPILNKMGAVFIDAISYEEDVLKLNKDYKGILSIKVNPNYLREFPVYDIHGNIVHVSESTSDWILLVPEKYHNRKKEIMSFFHDDRIGIGGSYETERRFYKRAIPNRIRNQQIRIIWLANNQKIFSFDPEVFPAENNLIIDPIIQVITEKNSLCADRANMMNGGGGSDPLKIRLINRDTSLTLKALEPHLKKLKLDDNLRHLITVNQFVLQEIYQVQKEIGYLLLISIGIMVGLLVLVVQNLTILFSKYQRKFLVRRLFGVGFFRVYKEFICLFSITWIFEILICYVINRGLISGFLQLASRGSSVAAAINEVIGISDTKLFVTALVLMLLELIVSAVTITILERRNIASMVKKGA